MLAVVPAAPTTATHSQPESNPSSSPLQSSPSLAAIQSFVGHSNELVEVPVCALFCKTVNLLKSRFPPALDTRGPVY